MQSHHRPRPLIPSSLTHTASHRISQTLAMLCAYGQATRNRPQPQVACDACCLHRAIAPYYRTHLLAHLFVRLEPPAPAPHCGKEQFCHAYPSSGRGALMDRAGASPHVRQPMYRRSDGTATTHLARGLCRPGMLGRARATTPHCPTGCGHKHRTGDKRKPRANRHPEKHGPSSVAATGWLAGRAWRRT